MSVGRPFLSLLLFCSLLIGISVDATQTAAVKTLAKKKSSETTMMSSELSLTTPERKVQRRRRPSPVSPVLLSPVRSPQQRRFRFSSFLCGCCFSRQSIASTVVSQRTTLSLKIQMLKDAIEADDKDALIRVIESVPCSVLYSEPSTVLKNHPAIDYAIYRGKFVAFKALLEHLCTRISGPEQVFFLRDLLPQAVKCGQLQFVKYLIEKKGATISEDQKLFHLAISHNTSKELLEFLYGVMDHSLLLVPFDSRIGDSVWHTAVRFQNLTAFMFLHEKLFQTQLLAVPNAQGLTPIQLLLEARRLKFLESIADQVPTFIIQGHDDLLNTAVHIASIMNALPALKLLLTRAPYLLNSVNLQRQTPLALAIVSDSLEAGRFLLGLGANPFAVDSTGVNILQLCLASTGRAVELLPDVLKLLHLSQPHSHVLRQTFVHLLAHSLWKAADTLLVKFPALWNQRFEVPLLPPAYLASLTISLNLPSLFDFALMRGMIPPNLMLPIEGKSILHVAAQAGNPYFIARLLEQGADYFAIDASQNTPFDIVMKAGNRPAMKAFLFAGKVGIPHGCRQQKFKAILLNGGSFAPYRPNRLQVTDFLSILQLFRKLFSLELKKTSFSDSADAGATASYPTRLVIYCMQFELFLAYHMRPEDLENPFVIAKIKAITEDRSSLAAKMTPHSEISDLLQLFSPAVHEQIEMYVENVPIETLKLTDNLIPEAEKDEVFDQIYLDYSALFNQSFK